MTAHDTFDPHAPITRLPAPAPDASAWLCGLLRPAREIADLAELLSPAEQARAGRFGRPGLRDRYIVGRASLRTLLGERLGVRARDVVIERGHRGRPFTPMDGAVDFNVSHTRDVVLVGITSGQRIGVDIEHGERALNVEGVARKFMAPAEREALADMGGDGRRRALLRLWTCKEAMSKATGDALSAPFRRLEVEITPAPRLRDGPAPYLPAHWQLLPVVVPGGFLATVALWHCH